MASESVYVELGLFCARVCRTLDGGAGEGRVGELSRPVLEAINRLTM